MIYLSGIIITFFLACILWSKKGKSAADNILAAWLCVIGVHLFLYYHYVTSLKYEQPHLLGVGIPMPLLHGPFLYLYTLTATGNANITRRLLLHFIPAFAAYCMLASFFILPADQKVAVFEKEGEGYELESMIIVTCVTISGFVYVLLSLFELRKYRKKIRNEFSNTERINLNWLRYLVYGILCVWIIVLAGGGDKWIYSTVVLYVMLLGYFGIKHMGIFTYRHVIVKEVYSPLPSQDLLHPVTEIRNSEAAKEQGDRELIDPYQETTTLKSVTRRKYEKSALQPEAAVKIHNELKLLMEKEKIFKEEELSLAQLAARLSVHPNILSQVINTLEEKSFYDYINLLRIEEFQRLSLLPENAGYTLLSLAFEVGFSSKTSFNRNFKKVTGQSPSEYLKEKNLHFSVE